MEVSPGQVTGQCLQPNTDLGEKQSSVYFYKANTSLLLSHNNPKKTYFFILDFSEWKLTWGFQCILNLPSEDIRTTSCGKNEKC